MLRLDVCLYTIKNIKIIFCYEMKFREKKLGNEMREENRIKSHTEVYSC